MPPEGDQEGGIQIRVQVDENKENFRAKKCQRLHSKAKYDDPPGGRLNSNKSDEGHIIPSVQ
jgi:hypothetical protein